MLGSKRPVNCRDSKNKLDQKYRLLRNHFICEFILEYNGFSSIHDFIIGTTESPYRIGSLERTFTRVCYPTVKIGSFASASRKFNASKGIVTSAWNQCLRNEWRRHKAYVNSFS